jgi:hypothetical protein
MYENVLCHSEISGLVDEAGGVRQGKDVHTVCLFLCNVFIDYVI